MLFETPVDGDLLALHRAKAIHGWRNQRMAARYLKLANQNFRSQQMIVNELKTMLQFWEAQTNEQ